LVKKSLLLLFSGRLFLFFCFSLHFLQKFLSLYRLKVLSLQDLINQLFKRSFLFALGLWLFLFECGALVLYSVAHKGCKLIYIEDYVCVLINKGLDAGDCFLMISRCDSFWSKCGHDTLIVRYPLIFLGEECLLCLSLLLSVAVYHIAPLIMGRNPLLNDSTDRPLADPVVAIVVESIQKFFVSFELGASDIEDKRDKRCSLKLVQLCRGVQVSFQALCSIFDIFFQ